MRGYDDRFVGTEARMIAHPEPLSLAHGRFVVAHGPIALQAALVAMHHALPAALPGHFTRMHARRRGARGLID